MAQAKDIREDVLWVIQEQQNEKSGGGTDLRIIRWIVDGKPGKPMLEKRDWYLSEDGDRKAGKAKGMTAGDFYLIVKNLRVIAAQLLVKPEHLDEALQLAIFQEDAAKGKAKADEKMPDAFRQAPPAAMAASGAPSMKF